MELFLRESGTQVTDTSVQNLHWQMEFAVFVMSYKALNGLGLVNLKDCLSLYHTATAEVSRAPELVDCPML